jgi:Holliday junction resolvasome RuvABC endonuclease subunit
MSLLDLGLALAGLPQSTIQELDKQLPALERLAAIAHEIEPIITKAGPDIVAVTPLIQQLLVFAKQKQGT